MELWMLCHYVRACALHPNSSTRNYKLLWIEIQALQSTTSTNLVTCIIRRHAPVLVNIYSYDSISDRFIPKVRHDVYGSLAAVVYTSVGGPSPTVSAYTHGADSHVLQANDIRQPSESTHCGRVGGLILEHIKTRTGEPSAY